MENRTPRPLIHNPNHQPPLQGPAPPAQSTVYHPPSSSQPPVQIPFSDPFQRRAPDPFIPTAQPQRRGSWGMQSAARDGPPLLHGERGPPSTGWPPATSAPTPSQSALHSQPPPPPSLPSLSSANSSAVTAPYAVEHSRTGSLGGGQSPPRYYGSSAEPQQLPTPLGARQMMPPSPPQQNPALPNFGRQQGPPPAPTFGSGRELPSLGPPGRPGSGISISSILGRDPATSQPPQSQPHHSPPPTTTQTMQPPSPRRAHSQSLSSRFDYGWKRPQTPERAGLPTGPRPLEASVFSAGSSPRHFGLSRGSPEYARTNQPFGQHQYVVAPPQVSRQYQSSPTELRETEPVRPTSGRIPSRPNSQPTGFAPPPREGLRDTQGSMPPRETPYRTMTRPDEQRPPPPPPPPASSPRGAQPPPPATSRDRSLTQPAALSAYSPPQEQKHEDRTMYGTDYGRDPGVRKDDYPPFRTGFRNTFLSGAHAPTLGSLAAQGPEPPRSHPQHFDPFRRPNDNPPPPANLETIQALHRGGVQSQPPENAMRPENPLPLSRSSLSEQQARAAGEEMQRSRSFLSIGSDISRRGRASPLPQAVQGAQAQMSGPSGDPSIKSEFGRIFQGLGSGLGGHIPGSSTPSRQSPMPQQRAPEDAVALSDNDGLKMTRVGSRGGVRNRRRIKDEDRIETESSDGRGTPLGGRGTKRPRISHHHHLPHHQPHHHHTHHGPQDELSFGQQPHSLPGKFNVQPTPSGAPAAHHHHHIHHHHHPPKAPAIPPTPAARKPQVKINSQAVTDMVKDLPRHHLGSEVYEPVLQPAGIPVPTHSPPVNIDKLVYRSIYKPSREFTADDWNCTFTIRIPRYYLTPTEREKVCADRNLFGTGTYTDDSDPVAVAIHSGWIRGEWGEDVDAALLDIPQLPDDVGVPEDMEKPLEYPIVPPEGCEAHITIRILPTLEYYQGSILNGIKSRSFGKPPATASLSSPSAATTTEVIKPESKPPPEMPEGNFAIHDGCSYQIAKIRWVDEGMNRGFGRTGYDRRKRRAPRETLAADALLSMFNGRDEGSRPRTQKTERMEGVELTSTVAAAVSA